MYASMYRKYSSCLKNIRICVGALLGNYFVCFPNEQVCHPRVPQKNPSIINSVLVSLAK